MLLLLFIYVVLRALWKIDVYLISTLVNKTLYYYLYYLSIISIHVLMNIIIYALIVKRYFVSLGWFNGTIRICTYGYSTI